MGSFRSLRRLDGESWVAQVDRRRAGVFQAMVDDDELRLGKRPAQSGEPALEQEGGAVRRMGGVVGSELLFRNLGGIHRLDGARLGVVDDAGCLLARDVEI